MKKMTFLTMIFLIIILIGGIRMADRNIQMGQRNSSNSEWDNHFPITKAENVKTAGGDISVDLANLKNNKADKSYVDTLTSSIASGSPAKTFTTLALLQADSGANTVDGKKKIYLVTADGKWYYWNGTAWTTGGTYQSTGVADSSIKTKNLSNEFLDQLDVNLFSVVYSQSDGTLQYGYDTNGILTNNNPATPKLFLVNTEKLDTRKGRTYIVETELSNVSYLLAGYDENNVFITNYSWSALNADGSITLPSIPTYIRITLRKTDGSEFVDADKINIKKQINNPIKSKINLPYKIVDINGKGDYTSVVEAVAKEPENTVIYILPGIYEGTIKAFKKRIILIGTDRNQCILKSTDGRYDYPVINGSCGYFENLTLHAEYVNGVSNEIDGNTPGAYAFHCEDEYGVGKILEFNNCTLISDFFPALGMGLRKNFTCIINDCELVNNQVPGRGNYSTTGSLGALYFHDSNGATGEQEIKVINSIMRSRLEKALCVYDMKKMGNTVNCEFINNTIYSEINGFTDAIYWRDQAIPFEGNFDLNGISHGNTDANLNNN